ncbi:HypC/HybG/HupF family hydrogenase formation chaperone [Chloroflexota bacterium]
MCVAIPYRVLKIIGKNRAEIEVRGIRQEISTLLVPNVELGDYILVYLGSATARIEEDEAKKIMRLYQEISEIEMLYNSSPCDEH